VAAHYKVSAEKDGKTYHADIWHHYFRFSNWVERAQLDLPEAIEEVCVNSGEKNRENEVDLLSVEEFAPYVEFFQVLPFHINPISN